MAHICHGKTYFLTAKLTFPRQNLLFHGKTYFLRAKLTFPRQNLLFHGKTYFLTAKLTFSRQNLLLYTAKLTFLRVRNPEWGIRNKNLNQSHLKWSCVVQMFTFISLNNLSHADSFWEGIHVVTSEENPTVWAFIFRDGGVIMFRHQILQQLSSGARFSWLHSFVDLLRVRSIDPITE